MLKSFIYNAPKMHCKYLKLLLVNIKMKNTLSMNMCFRQMCTVQLPKMYNLMYKNPSLDLQEYLEIPIFKKEDNCFEPSIKSMEFAQELFLPKKNKSIKCISSTIDPEQFPVNDLPEVAFLGRSNAGKSSLLKAILNEFPNLRIKTSRKPGMTKCLNFYQIGTYLCLVDMPGYGDRQPKWFESLVTEYLKNRKNLVKTFLLIDGKEGFKSWDDAAVLMLEDLKIPFAIIMTKIDGVSDSQRLRNFLHLQNISKSFKQNICFPQMFMLSSHSLEGLAYFTSFVAHITGNLNSEM